MTHPKFHGHVRVNCQYIFSKMLANSLSQIPFEVTFFSEIPTHIMLKHSGTGDVLTNAGLLNYIIDWYSRSATCSLWLGHPNSSAASTILLLLSLVLIEYFHDEQKENASGALCIAESMLASPIINALIIIGTDNHHQLAVVSLRTMHSFLRYHE